MIEYMYTNITESKPEYNVLVGYCTYSQAKPKYYNLGS